MNKKLEINPNSGNSAMDAAQLIIGYEDALFQTLSSDSFYSSLSNYIKKYYEVLKAHTSPATPVVIHTNVYEALTQELEDKITVKTTNRDNKNETPVNHAGVRLL